MKFLYFQRFFEAALSLRPANEYISLLKKKKNHI